MRDRIKRRKEYFLRIFNWLCFDFKKCMMVVINSLPNHCFRKSPRKPKFNSSHATEIPSFQRNNELGVANGSRGKRRKITLYDEDHYDFLPVRRHLLAFI